MFLINRIAARNRMATRLGNEEHQHDPTPKSNTARSTPRTPRRNNKPTTPDGKSKSIVHKYRLDQPLAGSHIRALRVTWRKIKGEDGRRAKVVMYAILTKFTKRYPVTREIFVKQAIVTSLTVEVKKTRDEKAHAQLMVEVLDSVIANLDENTSTSSTAASNQPEDLEEQAGCSIEYVGSQHCAMGRFGFTGAMFEEFGEIMAEELYQQDVVNAYPGGKRAWGILIARLTDQIRHGFDKQVQLNVRQAQQDNTEAVSF